MFCLVFHRCSKYLAHNDNRNFVTSEKKNTNKKYIQFKKRQQITTIFNVQPNINGLLQPNGVPLNANVGWGKIKLSNAKFDIKCSLGLSKGK